jgi:signal transduction histidine kinase
MDPDLPQLPNTFKTIAFMILSLPLRIVAFVLVFVLTVLGIVTTIAWVGIPVLLTSTGIARGLGNLERRWVRAMLDVEIPPAKRPPERGGMVRRWRIRMLDGGTWREIGYALIALPIGILEFPLGIVSIAVPPVAIWVTPGIGALHGRLALRMLEPDRARELEQRAERLRSSRARDVDAAEAERRRIERDLHDGAQQPLVAVTLNLGPARSTIDSAPDQVRDLIEEARTDAKLTVSELRDLARGTCPAILSDRGLDAALSALAARAPVPVEIGVAVDPRPPAAVESTAYFIVAETLTNVAKHAGAARATVKLWRTEDTVVAEITDNGRGGAEQRPGGGLAGLADRAAAIDGVITVVSPQGGPTVVRADLPCRR